jgi:hypothetical protein
VTVADWSLFARTPGPRYALNGGLPLRKISGVTRHLGVDTMAVELPYSPEAFGRTAKGCGLVAYRNGQQVFSGLIASDRGMGYDAETGAATIKVQALGDQLHARGRLVYPDPTRAGAAQTTAAYWTSTGQRASAAMLSLLSANLGPTARPERRVAGLQLGPDPALGVVRSYKWRFETVLDALSRMSQASGANLGLRVTTSADGLLASIYAPRNVSGAVRFSADLGNLGGFDYAEKPPEVTYALAAGSGDLTARLFAEATATDPDTLAWGVRIEEFLDQNSEDVPADLQTAAADRIVEGGGSTTLAVTLTDSTAATYGVDWGPGPGDLVTVYVGLAGQTKPATVVDVIREVAFDVDEHGHETIRPAIGTADAQAITAGPLDNRLRAVGKRLQTAETRR